MAICVGVIAAALVALSRARNSSGWDLILVIAPFFLWFVLAGTNLRPKSLANLVEFVALVPLVAIAFTVRLKFPKFRASVVFWCTLFATLSIYLFVPLLPE